MLLAAGCGAQRMPEPIVVPRPDTPCGVLGLSGAACEEVRALSLPEVLPPARGNRYGDDDKAAQLGFRVFFDARFSSNEELRCASCHQPERFFADAKAKPQALGPVDRNSIGLVNAGFVKWQFWDGRADSLWSQPLWAFENPNEMNVSRVEIVRKLGELWRPEYESVFGPLPDVALLPARGMPGTPEWAAMAKPQQDAVNLVVANLGKALEAYQRKLRSGPSKVDRFLKGELTALDATEQKGLGLLQSQGCLSCHKGPMLSDEKFHRLGMGGKDPGRFEGAKLLEQNPFNAFGPFWDGPRPDPAEYAAGEDTRGAFKTPTLRNLPRTLPYGHDGSFADLEPILDFHLRGGGPNGPVDPLLTARTVTAEDRGALLAVLKALEGSRPSLPWGDWPQH